MKAIPGSLAVLVVQRELAVAVPYGNHQQPDRHPVREVATDYSTVAEVVTVIAPNAVFWVDQYNNVLSTDYRGHPTPTPEVSSFNRPTVQTTTSNIPTVAAATIPAHVASSPQEYRPFAALSILSSSGSAPSDVDSSRDNQSPAASSDSNDQNKVTMDNDARSVGSGYGICYELIGSSGCKDSGTLNSDFGYLASQGFSKVRVYDIGCDLGAVVAAAAARGLQVVAGINTIGNVASDITKLVGMINGDWDPVDTIVVGNEVVNNGGNPGAVVAALGVARPILTLAGFTKNVVTVDTFIAHENNPQLCQASDYCAVNAHAFFDSHTTAEQAGTFVANTVSNIAKGANGKSIVITESGWPYQGSPNGKAIPSPANQQSAIQSLRTAFSGNPGGIFLFQAYDATYKDPGPWGVEQFFGIYGH
ncbi:uncharacterized protein Z518_09805 [Rhinocladiella mackenziei CBS 650.93]|uniref:Cell wall glucanase (Scw4) n=1 Tax=Rhinocladiella mackenziei CBS 650.93 TaxID=1442369 RepID=A0A0D2IVL1_9EURO|nr:uncharacterized protein Z518_09805 [Rhinocladiella mackenziei CBS 650.93]KIX00740.1 hypothetical protein Z518_09805 [Rhinocladiella mackenziei CBS 650.93]